MIHWYFHGCIIYQNIFVKDLLSIYSTFWKAIKKLIKKSILWSEYDKFQCEYFLLSEVGLSRFHCFQGT